MSRPVVIRQLHNKKLKKELKLRRQEDQKPVVQTLDAQDQGEYVIILDDDSASPQKMWFTRDGQHLIVSIDQQADVVIQNYYDKQEQSFYGKSSDGLYHRYEIIANQEHSSDIFGMKMESGWGGWYDLDDQPAAFWMNETGHFGLNAMIAGGVVMTAGILSALKKGHDVERTPSLSATIRQDDGEVLTGMGEPDSTVKAVLPTGETLTTMTDAFGHYSFDLNPALTQGENVTVTNYIAGGTVLTQIPKAPDFNFAPIATNDAAKVDENGVIVVDVIKNDTDVDQDKLKLATAYVKDGTGKVEIVDGQIRYTTIGMDYLPQGATEVATVEYTTIDPSGLISTGTLLINIIGSNDTPTLTAHIFRSYPEDSAVRTLDLREFAVDVDQGAVLSIDFADGYVFPDGFGVGTGSSANQLSINPAHAAFQSLNVGESKDYVFNYLVLDQFGASVAHETIITITGTNDLPVITKIQRTVAEDSGPAIFDLKANAQDVDHGAELTLSFADNFVMPAGLTLSGSTLLVNPNAAEFQSLNVGESTQLMVKYTVTDENGASAPQTATITITGTNDTPTVSQAIVKSVAEDAPQISYNLLEFASDVDHAAVLGAVFAKDFVLPAGLTVSGNQIVVNPSHSVFQSLNVGESTVMVLPFLVTDEHGATVKQTATITVTGTNDVPVVSAAIAKTLDEDAATRVFSLLEFASDVDHGAVLSAQFASDFVAPAGVTISGNQFIVDPSVAAFQSLNVGETNVITLKYNVIDEQKGLTPQTATITIVGTNDIPQVSAAIVKTVAEDAPVQTFDLLEFATDVDHGNVLFAQFDKDYVLPEGLTVNDNQLMVDASLDVFQSLKVGETKEMVIHYLVVDENKGSTPQTATILVTGTNDTPEVSSIIQKSVAEDAQAVSFDLLEFASDVDHGAVLSAKFPDGFVLPKGFSILGNSITVDPSIADFQNLASTEPLEFVFKYNVVDELGALTPQTAIITINGVNDAPRVTAAIQHTIAEDAAATSYNLLEFAGDVDHGAVLSAVFAKDAVIPEGLIISGNQVNVNPSHSSFQSLKVGESKVLTLNYLVADELGATTPQIATITITGTNDVPTVSSAISKTIAEDAAVASYDLLEFASDVDHDAVLAASFATGFVFPAGLTLAGNSIKVDPSNSVFQSLNVGESSVMVLSYLVTDEHGATTPQTATITVTGTNDTPTVSAAIVKTVAEDAPSATYDLLEFARDVDHGAILHAQFATGFVAPKGLTISGNNVVVNPSDEVFQSLNVGESTVMVLSYLVVDEHGATTPQTATITVTGTNDTPTVDEPIFQEVNEDDPVQKFDLLEFADDVDHNAVLSVKFASGFVMPAGFTLVGNSIQVDPSLQAFQSLSESEPLAFEFEYDVVDEHGATTPQTAVITIFGVNDTPTVSAAISKTVAEGAAASSIDLLQFAADVDHDAILFTEFADGYTPPEGFKIVGDTLEVDPSIDAFQSLKVGETKTFTFNYKVVDEFDASTPQTATVTITGTNDAPKVSSAITKMYKEDDAVATINLLEFASDIDHDAVLSASFAAGYTAPEGFTISGNSLKVDPGIAAYQSLKVGEVKTFTFNYNVVDEHQAVVAQTATVVITGTNDTPSVTAAIKKSVTEDNPPATYDLLEFSKDIDHDAVLHVQFPSTFVAPAGFTLTGNTLTVDPSNEAFQALDDGESKDYVFQYDVVDEHGAITPQTATITVNGVTDITVDVTSMQSTGGGIDSFTGASIPQTALFTVNGNAKIGNAYVPVGGSTDVVIVNDDNVQSITSGRSVKFTSKAGEFNSLSFLYCDLQENGDTLKFYTSSGSLIATKSIAFVGNGTGTFNSGNLGQNAAYFTIETGGDLFTIDNMQIISSGLRTIPNKGSTSDSSPIILGVTNKALSAGQTVEVLRDGVVAGVATVSGTNWSFKDTTSSGTHTYTAHVVKAGAEQAKSSTSQTVTVTTLTTPLVLDLDGNGVFTTSHEDGVQFDLMATGHVQKVSWISADDGFLAFDQNHNGLIDSGAELFGENMIKENGQQATTGWDALTSFDHNQDQVIDAKDAVWQDIVVWKDANSNGQTEDGELLSLSQAGVDSINLNFSEEQSHQSGNVLANPSTYTNTAGEQAAIVDVYLQVEPLIAL